MKSLFIFLFLLTTYTSTAVAANPTFDAWIGTWKGSCKLTPAYQGVENINTSLTVAKTSSSDRLQWQSKS